MPAHPTILAMRSITKEFPGVKSLSGVRPHGSYSGEIVFAGRQVRFRDIRSSEAAGIVIIHQELALIPELSIAENISLGNEPRPLGIINWDSANRQAIELTARMGPSDDPTTAVKDIGVMPAACTTERAASAAAAAV